MQYPLLFTPSLVPREHLKKFSQVEAIPTIKVMHTLLLSFHEASPFLAQSQIGISTYCWTNEQNEFYTLSTKKLLDLSTYQDRTY